MDGLGRVGTVVDGLKHEEIGRFRTVWDSLRRFWMVPDCCGRFGTLRDRTVWDGMRRFGTVWDDFGRFGTERGRTVWDGLRRFGTV